MSRILAALMLVLIATLPVRAEIKIEEVVSPGGITAWLVPEPSIPFVALELRFRGGASLDVPGKRGAINLMTGCWKKARVILILAGLLGLWKAWRQVFNMTWAMMRFRFRPGSCQKTGTRRLPC